MLLVLGARVEDAFAAAVRAKNEAILRLLLNTHYRANPNGVVGLLGLTALEYALANCNFGCTRILVEAGADVNLRKPNGLTPLFWLKRGCDAKCLIEHGANIDARDEVSAADPRSA